MTLWPLGKGVLDLEFFWKFQKLKKYFFAQNCLKWSPNAKKKMTLWPLGKGGLDLEIFRKFKKIEFFVVAQNGLKWSPNAKKTQKIENKFSRETPQRELVAMETAIIVYYYNYLVFAWKNLVQTILVIFRGSHRVKNFSNGHFVTKWWYETFGYFFSKKIMKSNDNIIFQCLVWEIWVILYHFQGVTLCQKLLKWQILIFDFWSLGCRLKT